MQKAREGRLKAIQELTAEEDANENEGESEGEESKTGKQIFLDNDRPSHGRVRFAAPNNGAPLTAPGRSEETFLI